MNLRTRFGEAVIQRDVFQQRMTPATLALCRSHELAPEIHERPKTIGALCLRHIDDERTPIVLRVGEDEKAIPLLLQTKAVGHLHLELLKQD